MKQKLFSMLALLLMAATGAVAQTETLLTTITATDKEQASYSTANVATVSFSYTAGGSSAYLANWGWWGYGWTATVTAAEGYTITKCIFYDDANRTATDSEAPFVAETTEEDKTPRINGTPIDGGNYQSKGLKKIEVYGYATPVATGYSVTLPEGTEDAENWTISDGTNSAKGNVGLTGLSGGETVTITYNGTKRVKGVTAVKAAEPSVPDGALSGVFSVSSTKQVNFSKGNLRYASGAWSFFDNQYDYYATYSADAWDKFGWSNSTNNFGMSTSTENAVYQGDLVDWGTVPGIGTGWFTLSNNEWVYLFNTRSASTVNSVADARYAKGKVNGVYGIILFPDTYTHPTGVTLPVGINEVGNAGWNGNNYSAADWTAMETAGCVFLPATGYREGNSVQSAGSSCSYRSSTRLTSTTDMVNYVYFTATNLSVSGSNYGRYGQCVRLVQEVAPTYTLLSAATAADQGKVVCAAGHLHDAKTAVPAGCTAVGILGKVTETGHGLILALKDATAQNWNTVNGWTSVTTYAGTTLKLLPDDAARGTNLTSYTTLGETAVSNWAVAQKNDYEAIFVELGSTTSDVDGTTYDGNVNAYITTGVGGTAMSDSDDYWSATNIDNDHAWHFSIEYWANTNGKSNSLSVRPVLGF